MREQASLGRDYSLDEAFFEERQNVASEVSL